MVYIYKKIISGRNNYYLRISKRIKNKVIVKDIAYLGVDISKVRQKLNNLSDYTDEIRKSYRILNKFIQNEHYLKKVRKLKLKHNEYLSKELLEHVEAIKTHYNDFLKKDKKTKEEVYREFIIDFVFNSNALEGNTITLGETARLFKEDIVPKNKTLREINDMKNSEKVFNKIINTMEKLDERLIMNIHGELLKDIDDRKGYRTDDVRVIGAGFKSTPPPYIRTDIKLLLDFYKKNRKIHPLVLASMFHHKFEKIHPFYDGNGRTGRMLMNYILMRNNYPPLIIRKKTRNEYLESLKSADKSELADKRQENYSNLVRYISLELIDTYWNNFLT